MLKIIRGSVKRKNERIMVSSMLVIEEFFSDLLLLVGVFLFLLDIVFIFCVVMCLFVCKVFWEIKIE